MADLTVNGRTYTMWSQFVEKADQWKRIINIDSDFGGVAKADLTGIRLEPNGSKSAMIVFDIDKDGDADEWSCDVHEIGIIPNKTPFKGLCLHANYVGVFILQNEEEAAE